MLISQLEARLAELRLKVGDVEVNSSIDIETNVEDANGEQVIAKLYGYSIIEVIDSPKSEVVIHFEQSESCSGDSVDVIKAVSAAQRKAFQP